MGSLLRSVSGVRWGEQRGATGAGAGVSLLCCPGSPVGMRTRPASPSMTSATPSVWDSSSVR